MERRSEAASLSQPSCSSRTYGPHSPCPHHSWAVHPSLPYLPGPLLKQKSTCCRNVVSLQLALAEGEYYAHLAATRALKPWPGAGPKPLHGSLRGHMQV